MHAMAGLLKFVSARGGAAGQRGGVAGALGLLRHRGPDDERIVANDDVVFGAEDLTVTEPVRKATQPVEYPPTGVTAGRYLIVLDGAVYNAQELRAELEEDR